MRLLPVILIASWLTGCVTDAPDMSRREARDITSLAIVLGPHP
jgi:hypothetical protein